MKKKLKKLAYRDAPDVSSMFKRTHTIQVMLEEANKQLLELKKDLCVLADYIDNELFMSPDEHHPKHRKD